MEVAVVAEFHLQNTGTLKFGRIGNRRACRHDEVGLVVVGRRRGLSVNRMCERSHANSSKQCEEFGRSHWVTVRVASRRIFSTKASFPFVYASRSLGKRLARLSFRSLYS